jgi:alpha-tubulin suppressor-like RCC1 family protein/uncharacterized protein YkuJ
MRYFASAFSLFFCLQFCLFAANPSNVPEIEPNDSIAQATDAGKTVLFDANLASAIASGNMSGSDSSTDYFEYYLQTGESISIGMDKHDGLQSKLYLKNSAGSVLDSDQTINDTDNRISNYIATSSDNYYISITYLSGAGNYSLLVTSNQNSFHENEVNNSNNSFANAEYLHQINTSGSNLEVAGTVGRVEAGDFDYYFLQVREEQVLDLSLRTFNQLTPKVFLYDEKFQLLQNFENSSANYQVSFSSINNLNPGKYYLKVSGNSGEGLFGSYYISGNINSQPSVIAETENNSSAANADPLTFTETFPGSNIMKVSAIGSVGILENTPTQDYFSFSGNTGEQVTITLDHLEGDLNVRLALLNAGQSTLAAVTYSTSDKRISAFTLPNDGTYYVYVNYSTGSGSYELNLNLNKGGFNEEETFTENNSQANAEIIPFDTATGNVLNFAYVNGIMDEADEDWYFVYLRENQNLNLSLQTAGNLMTNVQLIDPDFNLIESLQSNTPNETLNFTPYQSINPGSYYLKIKGISGNGYHANYTFNGDVIGEATHGFDIEPNDTAAAATSFNTSELFASTNIFKGSAVGSIGLKENTPTQDYYVFSGNTGDQVTITLDHINGDLNMRLALLNSGQATLSATGYTTADKRIAAYTLSTDGIYYIYVNYSSGSGVYELSMVQNKDGYNEEEAFYENDTQANAELIPFANATGNVLDLANVNGIIDENDEDWFFLYLREDQDIQFDVETRGGLMANVQLYDPELNLIQSHEASSPNETLNFTPYQTINAGSYYLKVTGASGNGYHSHYTFNGGIVGEATHGYDIEPNDTAAAATSFNTSELFTSTNIFKGSAVGSIGLKENTPTQDYYVFSGNTGDQVTITLDHINGDLNMRLVLQNSGQSTLSATGYTTADKRIAAYTLPTDGIYYIYVNYSSGSGVYELSMVQNKDGYNEEEAFYENDSQANAEIIPFANASGNLLELANLNGIIDEGDEDWFFLYLRESQTIQFDVEHRGGLMTNVQLLDPDLNLIQSHQSISPDETLMFTPFETVVAGSYYIKLSGLSGNGYHSHYTFIGDVIGEATHGFDIEPNDSAAAATSFNTSELFTATNIYKGSAVGSIGLKENTPTQDYYVFSGNTGDQVTITLDHISGDLNMRLALLNAGQSTLSATGYNTSDKRIAAYTLETDGIYYIYVNHSSGSGVYELSMVQNKDGYNEEETFYENDTQANAEIIPFANATGNVLDLANLNGIIDEGDEDWLFVYLRENQTLEFDVEHRGGLMTNVQLFDPDLNLLQSHQSISPDETLQFSPYQTTVAGSYFIKLSGISGNGYHSHYTFIGDVVGEASHGFDIEPNDTAGTATAFNTSELFPSSNIFKGSAVGSVGLKENSTTQDYFVFSGNAGDQVTITLDHINGNLGMRLALLNAGQSTLSATGYTSADKRISAYTLPTDGIYYLHANHSTGSGVYELSMIRSQNGWLEREEFTDNNSFVTAEFIGVENDPGHNNPIVTTTGILDDTEDDVFALELLHGMTLNLDLQAIGGWTAQIELYKNQALLNTYTSGGPDQTINFNYTETGQDNDYHIKISNLDQQHHHAHYLIQGSVTGDSSRIADINSNTSIPNAQAIAFSLNSFTNATEASAIGHIAQSETSTQSDHYFSIPVNAGDNLNIELNNTSSMDLDLYVYDNNSTLLTSDLAASSSDKSFQALDVTLTGNLIVRIDHQSGAGVYSLRVSDATANQPPIVTTFSPDHDRKGLIAAMGIKIRYDKDIQLGSSGNIVLFDHTKNQPIHVITASNNTAISISDNLVNLMFKQHLLSYDPDPFTQLSLSYESGLLEATDSTVVMDFPNPWMFSLGDFKKIATGETTTMLIRNDHHLWAFGDSILGESGNIESPISSPEIDTNSWWSVSLGAHHTLAITDNGNLYSFGDNRRGQLDQSGNNLGIQITNSGNNFIDISAGLEHSLALKKNGQLLATGKNNKGQLGLGDQSDRVNFTAITGILWNTIAAGPDYNLGIDNTGDLYAWGNTSWGILSSQDIALTPVVVSNSQDWLSVAAGYRHALATRDDNTLWSWGNNLKGQLGQGHNNPTATPTQIANNVKAIAAGAGHSLYIDNTGNLYSFGQNNLGQLGLGDNNDRNTPQMVNLNGEQARFISAGPFTSTVIATSGNVYAFGKDTTGTNPNTPIQVFNAE